MERASQQPGVKDEQGTVTGASLDKNTPLEEGEGMYSCTNMSGGAQSQKTAWHMLLNKMATALCWKETKCLLVVTYLCSFISPFISEISPLYLEMSRSVSKLRTLLSIIITADSSTVYLSLHIKHKSSSHISFKVSTLGWGSEERKVLKSAYHL